MAVKGVDSLILVKVKIMEAELADRYFTVLRRIIYAATVSQ